MAEVDVEKSEKSTARTFTATPEDVTKAKEFLLAHSTVDEKSGKRVMNKTSDYYAFAKDLTGLPREALDATNRVTSSLIGASAELGTDQLTTLLKKPDADKNNTKAEVTVAVPGGQIYTAVHATKMYPHPKNEGEKIIDHGKVSVKLKQTTGMPEASIAYARDTITKLLDA